MLSKAFTAACLAGAALSLDLNTQGHSNSNGKTVTDSDTEWKDANICITYGEDNSCSDGSCRRSKSKMCDQHHDRCNMCSPCNEDPCDEEESEVTYTSPEYEIEGIGSLQTTFGGSDDVTLTGTSSYEILGLCDDATVKKIITLTLTHSDTINVNDTIEAFMAFVDDDNILNGYVATYTDLNDRFLWERFTQATTIVPNSSVTTSFVDFEAEGLTKVLNEFFEEGDSQITATLLTEEDGYRLDIPGTGVNSGASVVTFKVVQEGDNDDLAIIAGGTSLSIRLGVVYRDNTASSITGASVPNAVVNFGAQVGTPYDDPCLCSCCHNNCTPCAHHL